MKFFIKKLLLFSFPIVLVSLLFISYAELTLYYYPSIFQKKNQYFINNIRNIEVLVLGSSHHQCAVNPEYMDSFKTSNLAFSGQNLKIDETILRKFIDQMQDLKIVVFELSYHTLEHAYNPNYHRNSLYLRFYDMNLFERTLMPPDYSIYLSRPKLYNNFLKPWVKKTKVNKYGFSLDQSEQGNKMSRFERLGYNIDSIMIDSNNVLIRRHHIEHLEAYKSNKRIFAGMLELCNENGITPVVVLPPVYKSYYQSYLIQKKQRRQEYINFIEYTFPGVEILNFEQNINFEVTDFLDEDHLNSKGAKKLSIMLNKEIREIVTN